MKNIRVLPTDKPSKIYSLNIYKGLRFSKTEISKSDVHTPKNIYITNDEEIKEGDWILDLEDLTIGKVKNAKDKHNIEIVYNNQGVGLSCNVKDCSEAIKYPIIKIILTTDQDLIKDGVQAIDDDFLEWFVKNPSCEEVDLIKLRKEKGYEFLGYEIIIPKEEPKQETLEEAAENYDRLNGNAFSMGNLNAFKYGAKWQRERSYSEEEVLRIVDIMLSEYKSSLQNKTDFYPGLRFEQLKKK